jgi:NEDD8-activating enzyme E1 regulatory subunit
MKRKPDEENFDEALSQAYRAYTPTNLPSHLTTLFASLPDSPPASAPPFTRLLHALSRFVSSHDGHLPITGSVPDMKSDTTRYVALQRVYRAASAADAVAFRVLLGSDANIPDEVTDLFLKNAHAVQRLQGTQWGTLDQNPAKLGTRVLLYFYLLLITPNSYHLSKLLLS